MGTEGRRLGYEYMYKYGKERFREFFVRKRNVSIGKGGGQVFCRFKLRKGMMIMVGFRIWNVMHETCSLIKT